MSTPCQSLRERLLGESAGAERDEHLRECAACREWWVRACRTGEALADLPRVAAPEELDARVAAELSEGQTVESRLERALRSLPRRTAPAILDDLVLDPAAADDSPAAHVLRGLSSPRAPHVLDRLVAEELADPERHRVERFVGDLERVPVPAELDREPVPTARPARAPRGAIRMLSPLAALAAGLLLWNAVGRSGQEPSEREYRFTVVRASSPAELPPMAQSFLVGLTGGSRLQPLDEEVEGEAR